MIPIASHGTRSARNVNEKEYRSGGNKRNHGPGQLGFAAGFRITVLLLAAPVLFPAGPNAAHGAEETAPIGDSPDGSRAVPVHRIPLLDEAGIEIAPDDELLVPFSARQTCATKCHNYETISGGWHFNSTRPDADPGRPGQPWIWAEPELAAIIPLSYRGWEGTWHPADFGVSEWEFTLRFARHFPGGGPGALENLDNPGETIRSFVSGSLEIDCLSCHERDPGYDRAEYALQTARQNFRWAAAGAASFALVEGSAAKMPDTFDYLMPEMLNDPKLAPPSIAYDPGAFDPKNRVFFDIVREIPNSRCYYCHTVAVQGEPMEERWAADEDVHLRAGLKCVHCHGNGLDHQIIRGYEGESSAHAPNAPVEIEAADPAGVSAPAETPPSNRSAVAEATTCRGCHLGGRSGPIPDHGRMTAPVPEHKGLPPVHFEQLTCTACHSGAWPDAETGRVKTSMAHALGIHGADKSEDALPRIVSPVFARGADGKIGVYHLVRPAFWGYLNDGAVKPAPLDTIRAIVNGDAAGEDEDTPPTMAEWTQDRVRETLTAMADGAAEGIPVYIGGGLMHSLREGELSAEPHPAAEPYLWPAAHDVRPAARSLGVRGCGDCHSTDSPFLFGLVENDALVPGTAAPPSRMIAFEDLDENHMRSFAEAYAYRPWLVFLLSASGLLILAVILIYAGKGLIWTMNRMSEEGEGHR